MQFFQPIATDFLVNSPTGDAAGYSEQQQRRNGDYSRRIMTDVMPRMSPE